MNKITYPIIAVLLAACIWMYIENRKIVSTYSEFTNASQTVLTTNEKQRNLIAIMETRLAEMRDTIDILLTEKQQLIDNPIVVTKTVIKKNEKVIPISRTASEYFNGILAKRYQGK